MRRRLLQFIGTYTFRYAWIMLPVIICLTGFSIVSITKMKFDSRLVAFLPKPGTEERNIRQVLGDYRNLEPIVVLLRPRSNERIPVDTLHDITHEMARLLNDQRYFLEPVYRIDKELKAWYESLSDIRLMQLLTPGDWAEFKVLLHTLISADHLRKRMAYRTSFLAPDSFKQITAQDPLGALATLRERLAYSRGPTRLDTDEEGYFTNPDGRLILLYPVLSPESGKDATRVLRLLRRTRDSFVHRYPDWADQVNIEYSGTYIKTAEHIEKVHADLKLILKMAFPLAVLLILVVFRKLESLIFIMLPPVVGLVWTLGLAYLAFGSINAITAIFLILITAMGLSFSIHLYHRFTIELYRQLNYYRALKRSYVETARGILASAVVVSLLFFFMFATSLRDVEDWRGVLAVLRDSTAFGHLGVIAGMGIMCNLAACLISIPLLTAIKHFLAKGVVKPVELFDFHAHTLYEPAIFRPRATLGVMLLFCVFFGYHLRGLNFSPYFTSISPFFYREGSVTLPPDPFPEELEDMGGGQSSKGSIPRAGRPILAIVHDQELQPALEKNDRLYENLMLLGSDFNIFLKDSLRTVLPSRKSQMESLSELKQLDLEPFQKTVARVTRDAGFKPEVRLFFEPYILSLRKFMEQADQPDWIGVSIQESDTMLRNVQRYMTSRPDGVYIATSIYPSADGFSPRDIDLLAEKLDAGIGGITLIGDPVIERDLARVIKFNLAILILASVGCILIVLVLHFRNLRLGWLTFIPIVAEMVWLTGAMALADLSIHFFTVLAMPLIFAVAMDNALQLTQYYQDRSPCKTSHTMESLGRVVLLGAGMIAFIYGSVALSSHQGLRDFGVTMLIGLGVITLGTEMLLPALLELLGRGQPLQNALAIEHEGED
jgi:predicted RND superfamily exporter protein